MQASRRKKREEKSLPNPRCRKTPPALTKMRQFCRTLAKEFKKTSQSLMVTTQHVPGCFSHQSLAMSLEGTRGIPQPKVQGAAEKGGLTPCRNYLSRPPRAGRSPVHTSPRSARPAAASWGPGRSHSDQRPGSSSHSLGGTHLAQGEHTHRGKTEAVLAVREEQNKATPKAK